MNETERFFEHEGAAKALLSFASSLNTDVSLLYTERYVDSELKNDVTTLKNVVGGLDSTFNCSNLNISQRFDNVHFWKVRFQRFVARIWCETT